MTFSAAELRQLQASDRAEDGPGHRCGPRGGVTWGKRGRRPPPHDPIICKTVRESIASMSPEALAWCIAEGYVTEVKS